MSATATKVRTLPVIEVFGPTVQGEGHLAGAPTYFVRFGGCDFRCSWCDSMYAVEPAEVRANAEKLTSDEILERLDRLDGGPDWVTLSGGNPAMLKLDEFVDGLHAAGFKVAVETQGSRWNDWLTEVDCLTISPKPPSSGMAEKTARDLPGFMAKCSPMYANLKIVVFDETDLCWAADVFDAYPTYRRFLSCGTDRPDEGEEQATTLLLIADRYRWLCEAVAADPTLSNVRVIPQLHVLAWSHARGV